jgi:hypothetical protein
MQIFQTEENIQKRNRRPWQEKSKYTKPEKGHSLRRRHKRGRCKFFKLKRIFKKETVVHGKKIRNTPNRKKDIASGVATNGGDANFQNSIETEKRR